jgi:4-amino-4-deoxy-L-arabinose transferase-like glycosyltransferase
VVIAVAVVATVIVPRSLVLPLSVIDWDESIFALVAQQMLAGHMPYEVAFDHKPIGLYFIFAGFFTVLGDSVAAIRTIPIVFVAGTAIVLAWLARKQFARSPSEAGLVAALYGLLTLPNGGMATNTEILMNLFAVGSVAFLVKGELNRRVSLPYALLAGISLGAMFQTNYLGGMLVAGFAAFYLAWMYDGTRPAEVLRLYLANGAIIFGGFALCNTLLILPLVAAGTFPDYLGLQLAYLGDYEPVSWRVQLDRVYRGGIALLPFLMLGAVFAVEGLRRPSIRRDTPANEEERTLRAWTLMWLFALLTASASGRFYGHFFLFLLPPSLMLSAGVLRLCGTLPAIRRGLGAWLLLMAAFTTTQHAGIFMQGLRGYVNLARNQPPDVVARASAAMAAQLAPGETIYVYDAQPIHYFQTRTVPPTRFAFPEHHLAEGVAARLGIDRAAHMREVLEARPRFVVVGGDPSELTYGEASAVLAEALDEHYLLTEIRSSRGSTEVAVYERNTAMDQAL